MEEIHDKTPLKIRQFIFKVPVGWRIGQTFFNMLEFIRTEKGMDEKDGRMFDPFYISDEEMMKYWEDFMNKHGN